MATAMAPTVEWGGRTWIMVPQETGRLTQSGPVVMISRREVEATVAKLERYGAQNNPAADAAKLAAWRQLLEG